MTIDRLRSVLHATPFKPFTLHLADGRDFFIPHPEFLFAPPTSGRTVIAATTDGDFEIIDLMLVTTIEVADGKATKRRKRRR